MKSRPLCLALATLAAAVALPLVAPAPAHALVRPTVVTVFRPGAGERPSRPAPHSHHHPGQRPVRGEG